MFTDRFSDSKYRIGGPSGQGQSQKCYTVSPNQFVAKSPSTVPTGRATYMKNTYATRFHSMVEQLRGTLQSSIFHFLLRFYVARHCVRLA